MCQSQWSATDICPSLTRCTAPEGQQILSNERLGTKRAANCCLGSGGKVEIFCRLSICQDQPQAPPAATLVRAVLWAVSSGCGDRSHVLRFGDDRRSCCIDCCCKCCARSGCCKDMFSDCCAAAAPVTAEAGAAAAAYISMRRAAKSASLADRVSAVAGESAAAAAAAIGEKGM